MMREAPGNLRPYARRLIQALVLYSVATYLVEVEYFSTEHTREGHPFFLWSERIVASIFTLEYFARWQLARSWRYPFSGMGVIDLVAIVPFWVGFFVEPSWLHTVRTLRVLRLLKFYRYSPTLQAMFASLAEARRQLAAVTGVVLMVSLFGSVLIHEIERTVQPEAFGTVGNSMWWVLVTLTTVGYGDTYPRTGLGKVVAVFIMLIGLGVVGAYIGIVANATAAALREKE